MRDKPFNTDYWQFGAPYLAAGQGVTSDSPGEAQEGGALPALWWLGGLIILVVIRVAYELMD